MKHISPLWHLPVWLMCLLVFLPIAVILFSWQDSQIVVWQHLIETGLARLLQNTAILMLGVGSIVMLIGVSLAWLTAVCEFPGRRWLDWALVLPLAIPTYVVAFVALGLLSYSGPVLTAWRGLFGDQAWYPDIRHPVGVVFVMSAVLYPYVYMLARGAFLQQGRTLTDAARTLGRGPWRSFIEVALPMARPAIVAGMSLALMEALADFGAVAVFNYDTFTTAIYKTWLGLFNLQAAAQLASLLLLFVAIALLVEQRARGGKRALHGEHKNHERIVLSGWRAGLASVYCGGVFVLAFVIPILQLLVWAIEVGTGGLTLRFFDLLQHTFFLGCMAAVAVLILALLVSFGHRFTSSSFASSWANKLTRLTSLGYALPGSVLAVGVMIVLTFIDRQLLSPLFADAPTQFLVGSVFALILAYCIRYFSVGLGPVQSGLERIRPHHQEVAHTLGLGQIDVIRRVYLPLLMPGMMTALLLVLVDVMKEMPATLLLRPFGWDTLAVRVYELTSEGEWERAALPSLTLVVASIIPVVVLIRRSRSYK